MTTPETPANRAGYAGPATSADVSDACDDLGVTAVRTGSLRPMWRGCPAVAGPVATLALRPATNLGEDPLPAILRVMAGMSGRLVLIDLEGRTDQQCWGGVLTACAQRFGITGALVNGAVRDVQGIADRAFPVFARAVHPARIRARLRLAGHGADVVIDGAVVHPGDIAVADADGAVFLPFADLPRVARRAAERAAIEHQMLARLAEGADPRDLFPGPER